MFKVFVFCVFIVVATAADEQPTEIQKAFRDAEIVNDVIPVAPTEWLKVSYENNLEVAKGNELTPTQVKSPPTITWDAADPHDHYTLIMTDPDAPSRAEPKMREFHHWLVGNTHGNDVASGEVLSEYVGSGPPALTGLHRYIFLLYKQPKHIEFTETRLTNRSAVGRGKFSTRDFAKKYNLGDPIAGNFYQAQYDDYVPEVHKQLGF